MATRLTLSNEISINGNLIPSGKYSIYSIPGKSTWTVIINKRVSWGTQYNESQDLVRIDVATKVSDDWNESFTFYFSNVTENSGNLGFT